MSDLRSGGRPSSETVGMDSPRSRGGGNEVRSQKKWGKKNFVQFRISDRGDVRSQKRRKHRQERDLLPQKNWETDKTKCRNCGPTPVARVGSEAKAPPLARPSLREHGWELALAYMIRIYLETGPRRVAEANTGTREQGRGLSLAHMWRIHIEAGPRSVAEAIAGTAQICCGRGLLLHVGGGQHHRRIRGSRWPGCAQGSILCFKRGTTRHVQYTKSGMKFEERQLVGVTPRSTLGR